MQLRKERMSKILMRSSQSPSYDLGHLLVCEPSRGLLQIPPRCVHTSLCSERGECGLSSLQMLERRAWGREGAAMLHHATLPKSFRNARAPGKKNTVLFFLLFLINFWGREHLKHKHFGRKIGVKLLFSFF